MAPTCPSAAVTRRSASRLLFLLPILSSLSGCTVGTIGPACGSAPFPAPPGDSVRVLTYNTALFSPIFQCGAPHPLNGCYFFNPLGEHIKEHANLIADGLVDGTFDVIAFNEVWDEDDGKDVLRARLCEGYSHYVKYVDVFGGGFEEDSGLMLFSKFEFVALPNHEYKSEDNVTSYGDDSDRIAYVKYEECEETFADCLAAKGAVMARLKHPSSGRIINTVATHLQADYSGTDYASTRIKQLRQVLGQCETGITAPPDNPPPLVPKTLEGSLALFEGLCSWSNRQWLVLMGDLNIPGAGAVGEALFAADNPNPAPTEWWFKIGNKAATSDSTGYALYDAWAETTSERDAGISAGESERLDYIWTARTTMDGSAGGAGGAAEPCVQHVWNPPAFEGLSDHRPVAADLNLAAPQCNPRQAVTVTANDMGALDLVDGKEAAKFQRGIANPGNMQWWRINEPGTFVVAMSPAAQSAGLQFAIYRGDNLSQPLAGGYSLGTDTIKACDYQASGDHRCQEVTGSKFVFPDGPHYVRVFHPDRSWTGSYWIAFYQYTCKNVDEACELLPNAPFRFRFPLGQPLNAHDGAWFRVTIQEQADSGDPQSLRFYARKSAQSGSWIQPHIKLYDAAGVNEIAQIDGAPLIGPTPVNLSVELTGMTDSNTTVIYRVFRPQPEQAMDIEVGWQTNLVLLGGSAVGLKPAKLVCEDETNIEWGEDEIDLEVNIDSQGWHTRGYATFDCNDTPSGRKWDQHIKIVRFLTNTRIRPVELDDNPDDKAQPLTVTMPMGQDLTAPERHHGDYHWSGGHYKFHFNMSKWRVQ